MNDKDYDIFLKNFLNDMNEDYKKRSKSVKEPDYKLNDIVSFMCNDEKKTGKVYIVDRYGTFEQDEEPSYDVLVESDNCLYKHIRESWILKDENIEVS